MITVFGVSQPGLVSVWCFFFNQGLRTASCTAAVWLLGSLVNSADEVGEFLCVRNVQLAFFLWFVFFNVAFLFFIEVACSVC